MNKTIFFGKTILAVGLLFFSCKKNELKNLNSNTNLEENQSELIIDAKSGDFKEDLSFREAIISVEKSLNYNRMDKIQKEGEYYIDTFTTTINVSNKNSEYTLDKEEQENLFMRVENLKLDVEKKGRNTVLTDIVLEKISSQGEQNLKILILSEKTEQLSNLPQRCSPREDLRYWSNQTCTEENYFFNSAKQVEHTISCMTMRKAGQVAYDVETHFFFTELNNDPVLFGFNNCIPESENTYWWCTTKEQMRDLAKDGLEYFRDNAPLDENGKKKTVIEVMIIPDGLTCGCVGACGSPDAITHFWRYTVLYASIRKRNVNVRGPKI